MPRPGEYSWGGGMSTNFWVSPSDGSVIVTMVQIIPFTEGKGVRACKFYVSRLSPLARVGKYCLWGGGSFGRAGHICDTLHPGVGKCVDGVVRQTTPSHHTPPTQQPPSPPTHPPIHPHIPPHPPTPLITSDLKFAVRDWTYRAMDAFAHKAAGSSSGGIAIAPLAGGGGGPGQQKVRWGPVACCLLFCSIVHCILERRRAP